MFVGKRFGLNQLISEIADDFRAGMNPRCPSVCLHEQDMTCEPKSTLYHLS